jgi:hypothetical protein
MDPFSDPEYGNHDEVTHKPRPLRRRLEHNVEMGKE